MKIFKYIFIASLASFVLLSCNKKKACTPASALEAFSFTAKPDTLVLHWKEKKIVAGMDSSTLFYTRVSYFDPLQGKTIHKLASSYGDSLVVTNVYKSLSPYKFTLTPYSKTLTPGTSYTFEAEAVKVPIRRILDTPKKVKLDITADELSTNAQEASEGPIKNLLDSVPSTYFHSDWHGKYSSVRHYIQVHLTEEQAVEGIIISFDFRKGGNGAGDVKAMLVDVSTDGQKWVRADSLVFNLPQNGGSGARVDGPGIVLPGVNVKYTYIRLTPTARRDKANMGPGDWFNMGDLFLYSVPVITEDPEAIALKKAEEIKKTMNK